MIKNNKALAIAEKLGMQAHPEGGFYKETYRSEGVISPNNLPVEYEGSRNYSTAIYFMLTSEAFSAFHKIKQDEFWFFHQGTPITFHTISSKGEYNVQTIGNDIARGQLPQLVVKGGDWFAAEIESDNEFALVSCTVSPGFDFNDFVLATKKELTELFPKHEDIISKLVRI